MALVVIAVGRAVYVYGSAAVGAHYFPLAEGLQTAGAKLKSALLFFVLAIAIFMAQALNLNHMTVPRVAATVAGYGALYGAAFLFGFL